MKQILLQDELEENSVLAFWGEGNRKKVVKIVYLCLFTIFFFALFSQVSMANDYGLGIDSMLEKYVMLIVKIFRWVTALAILITIFLFFQGRPVWTVIAGCVIAAAIIANLDKILNVLNLTGGFVF